MTAPGTGGPAEDAQMRRAHDLKVWPPYFDALADGTKTFEVRRDDRGIQTGDLLRLREWDPANSGVPRVYEPVGYTGREATFRVSYVLRGQEARDFGISRDHCVIALSAAAGSVPGDGGEAGICGESAQTLVDNGPLTVCILHAGHHGWHRDETGMSWTLRDGDATEPAAELQRGDDAATDVVPLADWEKAILAAADPVEPEDGGEALRREVCADPRWHDTNCAVGDPTGICGRYLVDGKCPNNPNHYGRAALSAAAAAVRERREVDYHCDRDFPGWSDLTAEQKGHVADIEMAAFWRGHDYEPLATPVGGRSQDGQERRPALLVGDDDGLEDHSEDEADSSD